LALPTAEDGGLGVEMDAVELGLILADFPERDATAAVNEMEGSSSVLILLSTSELMT